MILQRCWIFEIAELDRISPNSEKAATLKAFNVAAFSEFGEILSSSAISKIQHL